MGVARERADTRAARRQKTYTSLWTGAKNAFSPSSVVEYARLPAKTLREGGKWRVPRQRGAVMRTLKPTSSTTADSWTGDTPFSVTGAAGASDIAMSEGGTGGFWCDELVEPVSSCQTWGLRKKSVCAQHALILIAGKTPLRCVLRLHDCSAVVWWPSFTQHQLQRALLHNHCCTLSV